MVRGTGMKNIQRFHPEACRHRREPSTVVRLPLLLLTLLSACPAATARNPQVCVHRDTARRDWGPWLCHSISLRNSLSYRCQWGRRRGRPASRLWCVWDRWSGLELLGKQAAHPVHVPVLPSCYSQFSPRHPGCAKQMLVERSCINKGMCWIISK